MRQLLRKIEDGRATLAEEPKEFFMTLRDIAFWIRCAYSDASLGRLRTTASAKDAFDQLYQATADPYGTALPQFRYQRRKYQALLAMLPDRRYRDVLDIGCGLGVFTRQLAPYADHVLGIDISEYAVAQARSVSANYGNLDFVEADLATFGNSDRRFDLVILADVVYYLAPLTDATLKSLATKIAGLLSPRGLLLLVNHFFFTIDPPSRTTRHIHEAFRWSPDLVRVAERKRAFYLATVLQRQD